MIGVVLRLGRGGMGESKSDVGCQRLLITGLSGMVALLHGKDCDPVRDYVPKSGGLLGWTSIR